MTKDLLSVDTDYLESFLKKYCKPINYGHELLARYYSSRGRFFDAAKLQIGLATQTYCLILLIFLHIILLFTYLFAASLLFHSSHVLSSSIKLLLPLERLNLLSLFPHWNLPEKMTPRNLSMRSNLY